MPEAARLIPLKRYCFNPPIVLYNDSGEPFTLAEAMLITSVRGVYVFQADYPDATGNCLCFIGADCSGAIEAPDGSS